MRFNFNLLSALLAASFVFANDQACFDTKGVEGVCVRQSECKRYNGQEANARVYVGSAAIGWPCPDDPDDVICCIKTVTKTTKGRKLSKAGTCLNRYRCNLNSNELITSYECPGGNDVLLCAPKTGTVVPEKPTDAIKLATSLLKFEEGVPSGGLCAPYRDHLGYPTIGYGRLCKHEVVYSDYQAQQACSKYANGCTSAKAEQWLKEDVQSHTNCLSDYQIIKNAYNKASNKRKAILISMAYQMGCSELANFTVTLGYMAKGQWKNAADSMYDSLWARQTPNRVSRHAYVMEHNDCNRNSFCKDYGW